MATTTAKPAAAKKPGAPAQSRRNRDKESLYRPGSLHKWFALFSGLLVLSLVWMVWKDYDRAWKDYQKSFFAKQLEIAEDEAEAARREVEFEGDVIKKLRDAVREERKVLDRNTRYAQLLEEKEELEADHLAADNEQKAVKGVLSPVRYLFEQAKQKRDEMALALLHKRTYKGNEVTQSDVDDAQEAADEINATLNREGNKLFAAETQFKILSDKLATTKREIAAIEAPWVEAKAELAAHESKAAIAENKLAGLQALYSKNQWRNWPFLDFISPSLKVRQQVLDDIHDNWNFDTNVKVDRCTTCHLGIDLPMWGDPEVQDKYDIKDYMQAHSGLQLIAGKESPHKVERFGCSVCHHGVGWSTDFSRAAHTPSSAAERAAWESEHDYYKAKYIDYPMLPTKYVQGQCWKCHKNGMFSPVHYPETLDHGMWRYAEGAGESLVEFDQRHPTEDRKLGWHEVFGKYKLPKAPRPASGNVAAATRKHLLRHYYDSGEDDDAHYKKVVAFTKEAVHDHGWHAERFERGYDTVVSYGCQGCHTIQDFGQQVGYDNPPRMGPDLTFAADKLTPAFIGKWIKYPELYRVDTKMPSFFWFSPKDREWNYVLDKEGKRQAIPVTDAHMIYPELASKLGTNTSQRDIDLMNLQVLAMKSFLLNQVDPESKQRWTRKNPAQPELFNEHYLEDLPPGNAENGRELVASLGCMACHIVPEVKVDDAWVPDGPERFGFDPAMMQGPRITSLGSKLADRGWLNAWLANPRHYTSTTRMPDMRITDVINEATGEIITTAEQQRSDIITYLMGFKDEEFDALEEVTFLPRYEGLLRDMYETYFGKTPDGEWVRRSELAADVNVKDPKNLVTTLARVGEKLMARNGCFGCHNVAGHEDDQPIGTELTREGIKDLHQLDFGSVPKKLIPHTRQDFFFHKLRTPRVWDWAKVKIWQDKLRMPRFNFWVDPSAEQQAATRAEQIAAHAEAVAAKRAQRDKAAADDDPLNDKDYLYVENADGEFEFVGWPKLPPAHISTRDAVVGIVLGLVDEPLKPGILHDPNDYEADMIAGRRVVKRYACNNCHTIEGNEGFLWKYFANQGWDNATLPPNLFTQGLRTRTEWLVKFLKDPKYLRPIVNFHMPRFGLNDEEAHALARYFIRLAGREQPLVIPRPDSILTKDGRDYVQEALGLFNKVNCNKCHLPKGTPGSDPNEGGVAPPFSHAPERLRYDWVHALLHNPAHLIDGTKMPQFWLTPSGYGRMVDKNWREYQFWLRDDPKWQALYKSEDEADQTEAIKQLAEVQMKAVTDYLLWHYHTWKPPESDE